MIIFYWLFRLKARILSWMPMRLLYIFSGFMAFVLCHIVKYRKKVIISNLQNSLPGKNTTEIQKLANSFYRNLADIAFEIIKLESITREQLEKRVTLEGQDVLDRISAKKQGVVVVMSHTGNWEWISQRVCFSGVGFDNIGVVAMEMTNPYFEKYFTQIRLRLQKGKAEIIPFTQTAKYLASRRHKASMIIAIADQSPHKDQIQYRTSFLNQDTGVFLGPERIARLLNYSIVFCHVKQTGRGFYKATFELITETPQDTPQHFITETHVKMLENDILTDPNAWLWSHRRWKY
jgi:Kdo2-lipid IVA lauroyltransferase/acyltransferase